MKTIFPEPIQKLPLADIPIDGLTSYLSQADTHQILFMQFEEDTDLPEHQHEAQVGIVLAGRLDLTIAGKKQTYIKGDIYHIPAKTPHSAKIYAGYADITFFEEKNRYSIKK